MNRLSISFIFSIILILSTTAFSQQHTFEAGIEGGAGYAHISGISINENDYQLKPVFSSGLTFMYNFHKRFSIRTGASFEKKGGRAQGDFPDPNGNKIGEYKTDIGLDYITVPLLIRLTQGKKFRFFGEVGPYFGRLLKSTFTYSGPNVTGVLVADFTSYYKRFDIGITGDVGISLPLSKALRLAVALRYNYGLYNIAVPQPYADLKTNNNSNNVLIGLAYVFGTPKKTK